MSPKRLGRYAVLCGEALARAHARAGDSVMTAAYMGKSDRFERAILAYAEGYADQARLDYKAFMDGIECGRVPVTDLV